MIILFCTYWPSVCLFWRKKVLLPFVLEHGKFCVCFRSGVSISHSPPESKKYWPSKPNILRVCLPRGRHPPSPARQAGKPYERLTPLTPWGENSLVVIILLFVGHLPGRYGSFFYVFSCVRFSLVSFSLFHP